MNEITQTQFFGDFSRLRSRIDILDRLTPEFYAREVERIFRRAWLPVASVTDLPSDEQLRRRRRAAAQRLAGRGARRRRQGARLPQRLPPSRRQAGQAITSGCRKALSCGFHGWTYATDGRLIGVTDKTQFPDLDPEQHGLIPVTHRGLGGLRVREFRREAAR